jgi:ABC-2 type transport system ATP-binding protein
MIKVDKLTKYYGRTRAIQDVSFSIDAGEIVGFLGPNGAGKTTTMRILTCFSPASSGTVRIQNMDVQEASIKIRSTIGYLPENVPIYDWMRVKGYLDFVARAKGIPSSRRTHEIEKVAAAVGIDSVMGSLVRWLSKGYRQRVGLAQALLGDPPILILDEPTIGLDPRQIREIRKLIKSFSQNRTVILSTHILPEVSQVCDRVIIINKGSIVAEDTPSNLTKSHGKSRLFHITARAPEQEFCEVMKTLPSVLSITQAQGTAGGEIALMIETNFDEDIRPVMARKVIDNNWDLLELKSIDASLEDVFIDLVTEETYDEISENSASRKEVAA